MTDLAIRVENLSKRYRIGGRQERYKRFSETVMDTFSAPIRRLKNLGKPTPPEETIWALKDVSFEVERGEVLGIIGRNGAGKTTLLKILSRITEPTEGRVEIHGRVGSLLEVGTGFHPELTGRENVYLNGAILGMRRAEIDRKFDEIVAFSEIVKFLDTPVKRYSSGMRVRLAFAVAAHLEPEIMLIDEVLAVGDVAFQKKCLGKMGEVSKEGRTVLFVSHNMGAIQRLCQTGLWLSNGRIEACGDVNSVIEAYLRTMESETEVFCITYENRPSKPMQLLAVRLRQPSNGVFSVSDGLVFELDVLTRTPVDGAYVTVNILDPYDATVYWTCDVGSLRFASPTPGYSRLICRCPRHLLTPGHYAANFAIVSLGRGTLDHSSDKRILFEIEDRESFLAARGIARPGVAGALSEWSGQETSSSEEVEA